MDTALGMHRPSVPADDAGSRGCALIVDAGAADRRSLRWMLAREGFRTLEADTGEQALALFERERPDIVFMEIGLPGMDGLDTTRRIKQSAGSAFVPVLFLSDVRDETSLLRCTQAGGDDFLGKPISAKQLAARILAMERVRDLHRVAAARQQTLSTLLERDREEQALAERVLRNAVTSRNVAMDRIALIQRSATMFNGDLVLSQHFPDGGLRVLFGDFTGHGLAATVGALPVADAFHAMTVKGVSDMRLLSEINRKLYRMLPADRFMAACLISIPGNGNELRFWNGGMPSAWLRTAAGLKELSAHALPLGILPELPAQEVPRRTRLCGGDRLLLMSDGLLEAADSDGVMFINAGFGEVLLGWTHGQPILPRLFSALDAHCTGTDQSDDIGGMEIPLDPRLLADPGPESHSCPHVGWSWSLELRDERLRVQPSLETALRPVGLLKGLEGHLGVLETILAELHTNALEHGILGLSSAVKSTPEGFDDYYRDRASRLMERCIGRISIEIAYEPDEEGGCVRMRVVDSGDGFDEVAIAALGCDPSRTWGHGIPLLKELCESVCFRSGGSEAEVLYRLHRL